MKYVKLHITNRIGSEEICKKIIIIMRKVFQK